MQVAVRSTADVPLGDLARALASAEPRDFAAFWLLFSEAVNAEQLDKFAAAMSPSLGSNRKIIFRKLERLISFHEENDERNKGADESQ